MHCQNCPRHLDRHPQIAQLLAPQQQDDLQRQLCDGHPAGCDGDPFARE